jgi:hypothetical protein
VDKHSDDDYSGAGVYSVSICRCERINTLMMIAAEYSVYLLVGVSG